MRRIISFFTSSIRRKMLSSFAIVIVLVLAMVIGGFYQLNQVKNSAARISGDSLQLVELQTLLLALTSLEANLERFFVIGGTQFQEDIYRDLEAMVTTFEAQEDFVDEADDEQALAEAEEKLNTLASEIDSLVGADFAELSSREINEKIISIYSQIDSLKQFSQELSAEEFDQLQNSALQQESIAANVVTQFLVLGALVSLFVVIASLVVTRSIAVPLADLALTASQVTEGDLEARAVVKSEDEIGRLATAFNSMTDQLQQLIGTLEERVAGRTQRLEIVASLGERLGAILDLEQLLLEVVNQVKERFGYYHAHIYLLDEAREDLVVAAGTGVAGREMKAKEHHIPLNTPTSLVARAARSAEVVRVDNVREAEDWLPNPLLPDTYAEMAVPIVLERQVVGVLDVQADQIAGLDEGDANLLRSLANQVAVAIRNARLFTEVETALVEARAAQAQFLQQAWRKEQITAQKGQHHYARSDVPALTEATLIEAKQEALAQKRPAVVTINPAKAEQPDQEQTGEVSEPTSIVAPISFRNQTIGTLQLHPAGDGQSWSEDDLAVVEAVVDQLAQSAERLRLFNETREQAGREQTLREITDKLRAAPNMKRLIEIATEELAQRLSATHAKLELGLETGPVSNGNGQTG